MKFNFGIILAVILISFVFLSFFFCSLLYDNNSKVSKYERNYYGEILLGLNSDPRPPTQTDVIKGYLTRGDEVYVVFESHQLNDYGSVSYWEVK